MFRSREIPRSVAKSASYRASTTSGGTVHSAGIRVAGVPSRAENLKVKASSKRTSRQSESVSSNSSSVSPGNPTMMSVVSPSPGIAARRRETQSRYSSRVYRRSIRFSIEVEPLCIGRCTCSQTVGVPANAAITRSEKSFGCGLV